MRGLRLAALVAVAGLGASPATANPLTDCFERIAVAARHVPHRAKPHPAVHKVRHVVPKRRHKVHKVAVAGHMKAYEHRTRYILRPKACGTHEAMATPVPGAPAPDAPETMLAALAGPEAPAVDVSDVAPAVSTFPPVVGDTFTPGDFTPPGGPGVTPVGGFVSPGGGPGGPGGPGKPPVTPPDQPPPPPVTPPDQPPPVGPPVTPPDQPPPPVIPPPPIIPPPVITPPGGIPEPATWAMMIVGFFGLGVALRRRRPSAA